LLTSSAKAKGRALQQLVQRALLRAFPSLTDQDVRSTSMGMQGEDVQLSPAARRLFPYQIETKAHATFAIYKMYEQAESHGVYEPLLIIKGNHKTPLAIISADHLLELIRKNNESKV
jgi:hypothetical protein